jgi:LysR family glycine cleavage system transcriptional activator
MSRFPSFLALRAFEAAARCGSLTAAGLELNLTPSAISHQVRAVETDQGGP